MHRISQTAVDGILKSPAFQGNHTFSSVYLNFKKIHKMTYKLGMHTWKLGKESFDCANTGHECLTAPSGTPFFYRNLVTCIEFLLYQMAYMETTTYVLVKEYNEQNKQVYSKLHTRD